MRCTSANRLFRLGNRAPGLWKEEVSRKAVPLDRRRGAGRRMAPILEAGADPGDQRTGMCPTGWPSPSGQQGPYWSFGVPAALTPAGGKHVHLPAGRGLLCQRGPAWDLVCSQDSSKSQYPDWQRASVSLTPSPGSDQLYPAPMTQSSCKPVAAGQWASDASRCPSPQGRVTSSPLVDFFFYFPTFRCKF